MEYVLPQVEDTQYRVFKLCKDGLVAVGEESVTSQSSPPSSNYFPTSLPSRGSREAVMASGRGRSRRRRPCGGCSAAKRKAGHPACSHL